jgi:RNA polymerase sigma-70 factor (ECF subfamily)
VTHIAGTEAAEAALMNALYDEHATVLCRYAMRLTGDASRAEDVVQETLLRAWQPKSRSHNAVRALRLTLQETGVTR